VCKFRHLLEENHLGEEILGTVNLHLQVLWLVVTRLASERLVDPCTPTRLCLDWWLLRGLENG
jgi:hypothetical protein